MSNPHNTNWRSQLPENWQDSLPRRGRKPKHFVEIDGQRVAAIQIAQMNGISGFTFRDRLKRGWPVETAAIVPPGGRNSA